jgi:hypothetical protein
MRKIILSFFAIIVLVGSPISAAFSDVANTHWAKKAIEDMVEQGIISGYTDGTFKPSRDISKIESLILLSKVAGVNKYSDAATKYEKQYEETLKNYSTSYKKQVAYLLGVGVLQTSDLDSLIGANNINSPLTREEMAILITKILGKEIEIKNKSFVILPFADASKISAKAKPYVEFVYNEKIMSGIDSEKFSPNTAVTRAQAAIILNSIISKVSIKPEVEPEETTVKGKITTISTGLKMIWVKENSGEENGYEYDANIKIYINDKKAADSELKEGMEVELSIEDDIILELTAVYEEDEEEIDTDSTSISGEIIAITKAKQNTITIKSKDKTKTYIITSDTEFYINDKEVKLSDFEIGDKVDLELEDGEVIEMVTEVEVEEEEEKPYIEGIITNINKTSKSIDIELKNGDEETIYLNSSSYEIFEAETGDDLSLSDLYEDDPIVAFGYYKNNKFYSRIVILVEY